MHGAAAKDKTIFLDNRTITEWLLLPPRITWKHLESSDRSVSVIPGILLLIFLRFVFERFVFYKLGLWLGIPKPSQRYEPNKILEDVFRKRRRKKIDGLTISQLSRSTGKTEYELKIWFRKRNKAALTPKINKFSESLFRFFFYTFSFIYGIGVLISKPWFWDIKECWDNLPLHEVDDGSRFFYTLQFSYYMSCLLMLPFDNKRKDFMETVLHHISTCFLIFFSFVTNFWRIGTLIMVTHDVSDIFLDLAKACVYAKYSKFADCFFIIFAVVFFISRIVVFPFHLLKSVFFDAIQLYLGISLFDYIISDLPIVPCIFIFGFLLMIIFALNVFWFTIIVKMAYKLLKARIEIRDVRSDQSGSSDDNKEKNH